MSVLRSQFSASELAHVANQAVQTGRDVLTEPVLFDPRTSGVPSLYRPMTACELEIAKRYMRRCDKQRDYQERKAAAEDRRRERIARAERAAYDENARRSASAAMVRIAAVSR